MMIISLSFVNLNKTEMLTECLLLKGIIYLYNNVMFVDNEQLCNRRNTAIPILPHIYLAVSPQNNQITFSDRQE